MENAATKTVSKGMNILTGLVLTAVPVAIGLVAYNLFLKDTVSKLHVKMWGK